MKSKQRSSTRSIISSSTWSSMKPQQRSSNQLRHASKTLKTRSKNSKNPPAKHGQKHLRRLFHNLICVQCREQNGANKNKTFGENERNMRSRSQQLQPHSTISNVIRNTLSGTASPVLCIPKSSFAPNPFL